MDVTRRGFFGVLLAAPVAAFAAKQKRHSWKERWNARGKKWDHTLDAYPYIVTCPPRSCMTISDEDGTNMLRSVRRLHRVLVA